MHRTGLVRLACVPLALTLAACASARPATHSAPATLELAAGGGAAPAAGGGVPQAAGGAAMRAMYPLRPTRYVLDAALPDLGATASVWRMEPHGTTVEDVRRFAAGLGVTGAPERTATGWEVRDATSLLVFSATGATVDVSFGPDAPTAVGGSSSGSAGAPAVATADPPPTTAEPDRTVAPDPTVVPDPTAAPTPPADDPSPVAVPTMAPPVDVPGDAAARDLARALLDRLGVLAGQQWSVDAAAAGVTVGCAADGPCSAVPEQQEVYSRTVTFSPTIDGVAVAGLGWSVTLGEHSRVESVYGQWATPVRVGPYPLQSTAAAFHALADGTARYPGPQPFADEVAIGAASGGGASGGGASGGGASGGGAVQSVAPVPELTVHITGVSLGLARWDAYGAGDTVGYLVPTYRFAVRTDGTPGYDVEVLALSPSAVRFTEPAQTGEPATPEPATPLPGTAVPASATPVPEPAPSPASS